jgi:hemerythrin-like domain-containing protein
MLTKLGGAAVPEDAVGLLLDCHARIRAFTALAGRLARAGQEGPEVIRDTARQVRRYFTEALPLHARDEEESVLPRLRGRDAALDRALATMAREHQEHRGPVSRVVEACWELEGDAAAFSRLAPELGAAAAELERHFTEHLALEEAVIFPALRRLLSPAEDAAVVGELRARRAPVLLAR